MTVELCNSEVVIEGVKLSCECQAGHIGTHGAIVGKVQGMGWAEHVDVSWYVENGRVYSKTSAEGRFILQTGENIYLEGYEPKLPEVEIPEVFLDWWEKFQGGVNYANG